MDYIEPTKEFNRIYNLPRRKFDPIDPSLAAMRTALNNWLKTPAGTEELMPIQAFVLWELHDMGGFIGAIPVGKGKTHIIALAPTVVPCERPLVVVPAKHLREKTPRHFAQIGRHWRIRDDIHFVSYEKLGVVSGKEFLFDLKPDFIALDEMQYVKNRRGVARTKRIEKYVREYRPKILGLSGTFMDRSMLQGWHIMYWTLPYTMPLPRKWYEFNRWRQAVEEDPFVTGLFPGAITRFCRENESLTDGVGRRIVETPGIVSMDSDGCRASLSIKALWPPMPIEITDAVHEVRQTWETPGGIPFEGTLDLWRNCRTLGCGYYNEWDPAPPDEWLQIRRAWSRTVREILKYSRSMETPYEVALAASRQKMDSRTNSVYQKWIEIRDTFKPNTVPRWLSDYLIEYCAEWIRNNPTGLVWSELRAFCERLSRTADTPYFCNLGRDKAGKFIEDHSGPAIVSSQAIKDGYNLQYNWDTNLVVSCPPNNESIEQLIGRTHREFQTADEVKVQFVFTVEETILGFEKMVEEARLYKTILNSKLLYADYINIDITKGVI